MEAGRLPHRIRIVNVVDSAPGAFGDTIQTEVLVWQCFARVEPLIGRDLWRAQQVVADATYRVTIRYTRTRLTSKMRVKWGERAFEVLHPPLNLDEADDEMVLLCRETEEG